MTKGKEDVELKKASKVENFELFHQSLLINA